MTTERDFVAEAAALLRAWIAGEAPAENTRLWLDAMGDAVRESVAAATAKAIETGEPQDAALVSRVGVAWPHPITETYEAAVFRQPPTCPLCGSACAFTGCSDEPGEWAKFCGGPTCSSEVAS
jgi:hypothetical protein